MESIKKLVENPVKVVNIGLEMFYHDLKNRNVPVVHIDWKPSAGGKKNLQDILKKIKS